MRKVQVRFIGIANYAYEILINCTNLCINRVIKKSTYFKITRLNLMINIQHLMMHKPFSYKYILYVFSNIFIFDKFK